MNSGGATTEMRPSGTATLHIRGVQDLLAHKGKELGVSHWHTINQQHIDDFADVTGDAQWIPTDPDRASTGPFGAPREIAGGAEAVFYLIFEVDGEQKPACVADLVFRYYVQLLQRPTDHKPPPRGRRPRGPIPCVPCDTTPGGGRDLGSSDQGTTSLHLPLQTQEVTT